jgi:hypothetical protein
MAGAKYFKVGNKVVQGWNAASAKRFYWLTTPHCGPLHALRAKPASPEEAKQAAEEHAKAIANISASLET